MLSIHTLVVLFIFLVLFGIAVAINTGLTTNKNTQLFESRANPAFVPLNVADIAGRPLVPEPLDGWMTDQSLEQVINK